MGTVKASLALGSVDCQGLGSEVTRPLSGSEARNSETNGAAAESVPASPVRLTMAPFLQEGGGQEEEGLGE